MNKISASIIFLGLVVSGKLAAQDIHFSQQQFSPANLNPALTGAVYDLQASLQVRDQWRAASSPFRTYAASFDSRLPHNGNNFWSAGIFLFSDKAGDGNMGTTSGNLSAAYHLRTSDKSRLGFAVQGGFAQRGLNSSPLKWGMQYNGMQYDGSLATGETSTVANFTYADLSAGMVWHYRKNERYMTGNDQRQFTLGAAMYHTLGPAYSYYASKGGLPARYSFFAESMIGMGNSNFVICPAIYYHLQQPAQELLAGANFKYILKEESKYTGYVKGSAFNLGFFYRNKDALVLSAMMEFANYSIGFSYDINTSPLSASSKGRGGIEIGLRFVTPSPFSKRGTSGMI